MPATIFLHLRLCICDRTNNTDIGRLQYNSPTNQLTVSQVADWITCRLVNSPTANF